MKQKQIKEVLQLGILNIWDLGLKDPHFLSRAESKSQSNQTPACVILLTSYGKEIKTDIQTKLISPQPSNQ